MKLFVLVPLTLVCVLLLVSALGAIPADPKARVTLVQPDGTVITVRPAGDETCGRLETLDGYTVTLDASGWYCYADLTTDGKLRSSGVRVSSAEDRAASGQAIIDDLPKHLAPSSLSPLPVPQLSVESITGEWNTLIILIQYPDDLGDYPPYEFNGLANEQGYSGTGSIRDYFTEASDTLLTLNGNAVGWVNAIHEHAYYTFYNYDVWNAVGLLIKEAVVAADNVGVDYSQYDNDGDGFVDGLFVVHAGPGCEQGYVEYPWSHWSTLTYWEIMPYYADGVIVNGYTIIPELQNSADTLAISNIGVFCHELGHMFGVTDLYVTSGTSRAGYWCLMASGCWMGPDDRHGAVPSMMCAYARNELGWVEPIRLTEDLAGASVSHLYADNDVYQLWGQGAIGPEYFLVEYRRAIGFDSYQPGSGTAIWHVDERYYSNSHTTPGVCVMQAMDGEPGYDATDLWLDSVFNGETVPNSYDNAGFPTDVSVRTVSATADDDFLMADFEIGLPPCVVGVDTDGDGVEDCDDNCRWYPNADQADLNGNLLGDVCEDDDLDGWANYPDNCDTIPNPGQEDWDSDGIGDLCDDSDGDTFVDAFDNCVSAYNPDQADWDTNGIGDACDDYDGDGIVDAEDNCVEISNPDQADWNDNGIGDLCDACCGRYTSGFTGNANCSEDGKITLGDISALIDRVFISKQLLCCEESGNADGDVESKLTLSDISRLIDHVFISKLPTEMCE